MRFNLRNTAFSGSVSLIRSMSGSCPRVIVGLAAAMVICAGGADRCDEWLGVTMRRTKSSPPPSLTLASQHKYLPRQLRYRLASIFEFDQLGDFGAGIDHSLVSLGHLGTRRAAR